MSTPQMEEIWEFQNIVDSKKSIQQDLRSQLATEQRKQRDLQKRCKDYSCVEELEEATKALEG